MSTYGKASQRPMFSFSTRNALTPYIEGARLQLPAHKINNLGLIEPIFDLNDLERGSVLPGHFDNPANVITGKSIGKIIQIDTRCVGSLYVMVFTGRYYDEFSLSEHFFNGCAFLAAP